MCGLAGIICLGAGTLPPERSALARMAATLSHRGPDEYGMYRSDRAGLSHARLSIVDLNGGQQPMADSTGTVWIAFNGEIFNYVELRQELIELGYRFRTHSDTEVILQAWRAWGEAAFERMNGQWAVALWDSQSNKLLLTRDPVGICPLYFCEHQGYLYFASEVKAIFAANPSIPRSFDPIGLDQTLTFWSVVPPQSVFTGVKEVAPGEIRTIANSVVRTRQIQRQYSQFSGTLEDAVAATRSALAQATSLRVLRADVPVGSYLSGGLDSSLVAALGQQATHSNFQTFSLRFSDAEYDETEFQRLMVEKLGTSHHEVVVTRQDIANVFPTVVHHTERPILRTAPAPLFLLSKLVRESGIKVVLTGEGADEMFAGYDLFREGKVRRFWGRSPESQWRHRLLERLYPYLARSPVSQQAMARQFFGRDIALHATPGFAHATRWQTTSALKRLLSREMQTTVAKIDAVGALIEGLPPEFHQWDPLTQDQFLETKTLLAGYLLSSQGDRMLLGNSIEGRFPFLDKDVMQLAHSLPPAYKLRVLDEKHVLKKLASGFIPNEIIARKKQPYRAPDALSFIGDGAPDYVEHALSEAALRDAGVFDVKAVYNLYQKCKLRGASGQFSNTDNMALVAVLSTQLLHQQFIANCPTNEKSVIFKTDIDHTSALRR